MSKLLQFSSFNKFSNWSVKSNLVYSLFQSQYKFVSLEKLIEPRKEKVKKSEYKNDIDIVKKISFNDGKIHLREERKTGMDMYKLYPSDLLVSKINFHQGALAVNNSDILLCSTHYQPYIIENNIVLSEYLVLILRTKTFQKYINFLKSEGIKTEATYDFIKSLKIPLPSLEKQKEIVESYHEKLNSAFEQETIVLQKEKEIYEYLYNTLEFKIIERKKNNKFFKFINFKNLNRWDVQSNFFNIEDLKSKYNFIKIKKLVISSQYGLSEKANLDSANTPFLRMNNIQQGELDIQDLKYIKLKESQKVNYLLNKGDILFNRTNSKELVGKCAVFNLNGEYSFASYLIRLKLDVNLINNNYFTFILNSPIGRMQIDAISRQITGQVNINAEELKNFKIPLPSLEIQDEIINKVNSLKNEIIQLKEESKQNKFFALEEFEKEIFLTVEE